MTFRSLAASQKPRAIRKISTSVLHSSFDIRPSSLDIPTMLDLATASRSHFAACVGQRFEIPASPGSIAIAIELAEVRPLGGAAPGTTREPFALTFRGAPALRLPQRIYRLENATLGILEIFLVPIAGDATASHFEAIFN